MLWTWIIFKFVQKVVDFAFLHQWQKCPRSQPLPTAITPACQRLLFGRHLSGTCAFEIWWFAPSSICPLRNFVFSRVSTSTTSPSNSRLCRDRKHFCPAWKSFCQGSWPIISLALYFVFKESSRVTWKGTAHIHVVKLAVIILFINTSLDLLSKSNFRLVLIGRLFYLISR